MKDLRSFGFLIRDLSRLYTRRFEERARPLGLTLAQCKVLVALGRHEGVSQSELGELAEIEPMNLVRILDHMENAGWLERRRDPEDRRARRLFLKPASAALIDKIWSISDSLRTEVFKGISRQQAKPLLELLEKLHHNVSTMESPSPESAVPTLGSPPRESKTVGARSIRSRTLVRT